MYLPQCSPFTTTSKPLSRVGWGYFGETHAGSNDSDVLYLTCRILGCPATNSRVTAISLSLKCPPLIITFSWTPSSRESKSGCCGKAGRVLELETAVVGIGLGLALNDGSGFQEGVDSVGKGVWGEGFQAGIDKGAQLGMEVKLPELEGAED